MKHAIVTLAIGQSNQKMLTLVKPFFEAYSKKVEAEFIIIDQESINGYACHLEKFQIYELLKRYDRIAYFDVDIIIQPNTPNVFEIVPMDCVGCVYDNASNTIHENNRKREIINSQKGLGDINWTEGYINSGVIVLSNIHDKIFTNPELRHNFVSGFKDQTLINYNIQKYKYSIFKLDKRYNGMEINGFSSRNVNPKNKHLGKNKTAAYCMHFANEGNKLVQMYEMINAIQFTDSNLRKEVANCLNFLKTTMSRQNARNLRLSKRRFDIPSKITIKSNMGLQPPHQQSTINNPKDILVFYDISELGWSMYLAAHLKYLKKNNVRVGIICSKAKEVLYRDSAEIILPIPKLYTDKFQGMMSDGNHLFDPSKNIRIKDHQTISIPFKRAYPKFNIITTYSKFEGERIFEQYQHAPGIEKYCLQRFSNTPVIIVFPRHRESKFKCRDIPKDNWIKIIHRLCDSFPKTNVVSIGSKVGAYDIDIEKKNYYNLVKHVDSETLDILVALCNTGQAITTIGNQSGTVKIALLCKTPTYIFGDEEARHVDYENWSNTEAKFWKVKSTATGYHIVNFNEMVDDIVKFINNQLNRTHDHLKLKKQRKIPPIVLSNSKNNQLANLNTTIL